MRRGTGILASCKSVVEVAQPSVFVSFSCEGVTRGQKKDTTTKRKTTTADNNSHKPKEDEN